MERVAIWNASQAVTYHSKPHVEVRLPGPKVAAALHEMRVNAFVGNAYDRAFVRCAYTALALVVDQFDPLNPGKPLPPVVFDWFTYGVGGQLPWSGRYDRSTDRE